ncbi:MAG: hypothetical protein QME12_08895, partial [Nanoarchaeota archaeon]|nr:hypothetical protein [Nanoarchaeota archaeon]
LGYSETRNYREYRRGNTQELTEEGSAYYMLYVVPKFTIAVEHQARKYIPTAVEYRGEIEKPTLLDSHQDDLLDEEAYFKAQGFDVIRRVVVDFNSGNATRPGCSITDSLMKESPERIIENGIHEDFHHNRRYTWGHIYIRRIEEPVAALVGLAGAVDFASGEYGIGFDTYEKAVTAFEKWRQRVEFTNGYYEELSALYARDIPEDEKARLKQEIQDRAKQEWKQITGKDAEVNNALLMRDLPYTWLFPYAYSVYEAHPDMGELVMILKDVPVDEAKAIEYLERFSTSDEVQQ